MSETGLLVGTRKGLLVGRSSAERTSWTWSPLAFSGWVIDYAVHDPHSDAIWVCASAMQWGPRLQRSDDGGATWREAAMPAFTDGERSVESVWTVAPARSRARSTPA